MSNVTLRQLELLQIIPRYPVKISTSQIKERMDSIGHEISMRMIQRDLEKLESILPIICDDRNRPYGWSWTKDSVGLQPSMNLIEALTFSLAEQYLKPLMPNKSFKRISIFFDRANEVLKGAKKNQISRWRSRVRVESQWQRLLSPSINEKIEAEIYDALLHGNQLEVSYTKRLAKSSSTRIINPLGIVLRGAITYLVCTVENSKGIRHLPLHRFRKALWNGEKAVEPKDFSLDKYVKQNNLGFLISQKPINLHLLFEEQAGFHLFESPLTKDQKIVYAKDGRISVKASISNTEQLRWWIWGFGSQVEVVSPKSLRKEFSDGSKRLRKVYS